MTDTAANRFAIAEPPGANGIAYVEGAELHHMRDVMRLSPRAAVTLLDGAGGVHHGTIDRYESRRAVVRIEWSQRAPADARIIVAAAIVKGPRMDFMVEKCAELGADELWPLLCARGVVKAVGTERLSRWRRLALAAAKQSRSARTVEVRPPMRFDDLIRTLPGDTLAVICAPGSEPLGEVIRREKPRAILIAVGPEGDFDAHEMDTAIDAGFIAVALGPNRLRSETAAIAAVSIAAGTLEARRAGQP